MRLKQIKLAGFKSFVDSTTLVLPGNRCAIVGPNGCGKSNVIDAVRWVMGESSAKQLRGESITDVIFNGSSARKPTSVASIELVFDNSDGRIGGEYASYAEIAIRREVTREGQSNYYLNSTRCRRRDVQDVFLGTGFGPRSYSIIEQGMISQLVEAKPEELRVYFEEAAGISKFKERRRESENRLSRTRENLDRLNDIREELDRQLDRLQRQSKAAERYRELKKEETSAKAQLYAFRYKEVEVVLDKLAVDIGRSDLDIEAHISSQRSIESDMENKKAEVAALQEELNTTRQKFYQEGIEISRIEEGLRFNKTQREQLESNKEGLTQKQKELSRQLQMDETAIEDLKKRAKQMEPELEKYAELRRLAELDSRGHDSELTKIQTNWEECLQEVADANKEILVLEARRSDLRDLIEQRQSQLQTLKRDSLKDGSVESDELVEQLALEISGLETEERTAQSNIDGILSQLDDLKIENDQANDELELRRHRLQEKRNQLAALQGAQDAALGRDYSESESWVNRHGLGGAKRLGQDLGVAAGWETVVEFCLDGFVQAIQVELLAPYLEDPIKADEGGFFVIEPEPVDFPEQSKNESLGLPQLSSLVTTAGDREISLLPDIYAAPTLDEAIVCRDRLRKGESILTRDGYWVGRNWFRLIDNSAFSEGIISRSRRIEVLSTEIEEELPHLTEIGSKIKLLAETRDKLQEQRDAAEKDLKALSASLGERRTDHGVNIAKSQTVAEREEALEKDKADLQFRIDSEEEGLLEIDKALEVARAKANELSAKKKELGLLRDFSSKKAAESREKLTALNGSASQIEIDYASVETQLRVSETARERLFVQRKSIASELDEVAQKIGELEQPNTDQSSTLQEKLSFRRHLETDLSNLDADILERENKLKELDLDKASEQEAISSFRERLESLRVERQGLLVKQENAQEQLTALGYEVSDIAISLTKESTEEAYLEEIASVERRIARLGAINLAAIEEYDQEKTRKDYLDSQATDLEEAVDTLSAAINSINQETKERFGRTFEQVNEKLGELFPKLFGGGKAYLELTDNNLLEAGVSLMAQPPGKKNSSVQLLSGGEKAMTAVALIFSIFQLNPSPVCLLDEVDAPLDDINVTRFTSLIKEMSATVQFLVITHNKITMEMADFLMGVTMQEPGVSRLVSVDVEAAAELAIL